MKYDWTVTIGGVDVSQWVKAGGTIDRGKGTVFTAFNAPQAVFEMFTEDENPTPAPPVWPTVQIGAPVIIHVTHDGVKQWRRFTGKVQALDYSLYSLRVTATGLSTDWGRIYAGFNSTGDTIPNELETARVQRWCTQVGAPITIEGVPAHRVRAVEAWTLGQPLLDVVLRIAEDCDGLLMEDPLGVMHYRTRNFARPARWMLPSHLVESTSLDLVIERGTIANAVQVYYGEPNPATGNQDYVLEVDTPSIQAHGTHAVELYTDIQYPKGARAKALRYLEKGKLQWHVPDCALVMSQATAAEADAILDLQENWRVSIGNLPAGCPISSFDGDILGFTEIMHETDYRLVLHLGPPVGDPAEPPVEPVFEPDSLTGGTTFTYEDQFAYLWQVHTWTTVGSFTATCNHPFSGDALIVAGGGAGGQNDGSRDGGGGGAGGVYLGPIDLTPGTVSVVVGAGDQSLNTPVPTNGHPSSVAGIVANGGGHGGNSYRDGISGTGGWPGGSGGGGAAAGGPNATKGGLSTPGTGAAAEYFHGHDGVNAGLGAGPGGGAGGNSPGANAWDPILVDLTGTPTLYAAGGTPGNTATGQPYPGSGGRGATNLNGSATVGQRGEIIIRYRIG